MDRSSWFGIGLTVVFHVLLVGLCFSGGLKYTYPPPQEQAMLMEFPEEEIEPMQFKAGIEPRAENPDPKQEVVLVKRSEGPAKGVKNNQAQEATVGDKGDVEIKEPPRQINQRALFPSAANDKKDTLAAQTSTTPSDNLATGHASGNTKTGAADGEPSARLAGRDVVGSLPLPSYNVQKAGRVVVSITVDQQGNVTSAIPGGMGTTVQDRSLWNAAKQAALKAKFNANMSAPASQEGTITYIFKLK